MTSSELERVKKIEAKMAKICRFFDTRDEMNGWIHLESPRYSPITVSAREVRDELMCFILENK